MRALTRFPAAVMVLTLAGHLPLASQTSAAPGDGRRSQAPQIPANLFKKPTGPFAVGTHDTMFIDSKRAETLTRDPSDRRHVPVQIWYPAEPSSKEPESYIRRPEEFGSFPGFKSVLHVKTNSVLDAPIAKGSAKYPVLLYNHGGSWTRFSATFEFEQLASLGYVVVSVDHLGFDKTELLPDGYRFVADTLESPKPGNVDFRADVKASWSHLNDVFFPIWVEDARFVLDQVVSLATTKGSPWYGRLDLDRIGAFGWSFGGATAMELAVRDPRVKAAIDQDGQLFGAARSTGSGRPVMMMHNGADPVAGMPDSIKPVMAEAVSEVRSWDSTFRALASNDVYDVTIERTNHGFFSDLMLFYPKGPQDLEPRRAHDIIVAYTVAFFDRYLKGRPSPLLNGPDPAYPEVKFAKKTR